MLQPGDENDDVNEVSWSALVRPRQPALAARLCLGFTGMAALVQLTQTALTQVNGGVPGLILSYALPVALIVMGVALVRWADDVPAFVWLAVPLAGLGTIVLLDLTSHDTTVLAQVFLFFPVLFASSQLATPAALLVTVLTIAGECAVTFDGKDAADATVDTAAMTVALGTASVLLILSAGAQATLADRLAAIAGSDALTGVATRRTLDALMETQLAHRPDRRRGVVHAGTALLLIDLDMFKSVNDTYGHPAGDDYLVHTAGFLTQRLRSGDVVARLGGDEFAVLMPGSSHDQALAVAQRLVDDARSQPFALPDGTRLALRFSVGVGHVDAHTRAGNRELYAAADAALYTAKAAGRGRVR